MTNSLDVDLVAQGVRGVQENADELSLQWGLRPATVTAYDDTTGLVAATYDGDVDAITMISLIGNVAVDEKIHAIRIPPSGNYVVGRAQGSGAYSSGVSGGTSTASTTYVVTASQWGKVFVAPGSGKVLMMIRSSVAPAAGPATAWMSPSIRLGDTLGSGTVFQAASDSYALMLGVTGSADIGTQFQITGLSPGVEYNAELQHRTSAGTSFWSRREIIITPSN